MSATRSRPVLVIGAGPFQLPLIRRLKERGLAVAAVDGDARAPGLGEADFAAHIDFRDVGRTVAFAHEAGVCAATTVASDIAVRALGAVNAALGLPGPDPEMARRATDKSLARRLLAAHGVPSPVALPVTSTGEAYEVVARTGLPAVVKPVDNAGSRGVSLVDGAAALAPAVDRALTFSPSGVALIEEFMPGPEISVEGFALDGRFHILALSDKRRTPPPYLLDVTVSFPSLSAGGERAAVESVAGGAVRALGLDRVAVHMELIRTGDGPKVVEVAARGAGFHVFTRMLPWVTGIEVIDVLIDLALGKTPEIGRPLSRGAVLHFPSVRPGRVLGVRGIEAARRLKDIAELTIYVRPGDIVGELRSGAQRVGHLITLAETRADAERAIAAALGRIEIETAPVAAAAPALTSA